jgi:transposase
MAYDSNFKLLVIKYKDAGHTFAEMYEAFGVGSRRYYVWKKEFEETGTFTRHYAPTHPGKIDPEKLLDLLAAHPDWYLYEFARELGVCEQAIQKRFKKLNITRKKKLLLIPKSPKRSGESI